MARLTRLLLPLAALAPLTGCWWRHYKLSDLKTPPSLADELARVPDSQPRILRCDDGREWIRIDQRLGFRDLNTAWNTSAGTVVWSQGKYYSDVCLCPPGIDTWGALPDGKPPRFTGWLRDDDEVARLRKRFPSEKTNR